MTTQGCRTCGGNGWEKGPVDEVFEFCPDCVGKNVCPQCGADLQEDEIMDGFADIFCTRCGWDINESSSG